MSSPPPFVRLDGKTTNLIVDCRGDTPIVLHWGARLSAGLDPMSLVLMASRAAAPTFCLRRAPARSTARSGPCSNDGILASPTTTCTA